MTMTFPIIYFLYAYYAFLVIWVFFCLVVVFHILKYGFKNFTNFLITLFFIIISILLVMTSFYFINKINWETNVSIFKDVSNTLEY